MQQMMQSLRILHTSDWHLGRQLYGKRRIDAFSNMTDWMIKTIEKEHIDVVLISGDIFDNTTPSAQVQAIYYRFLSQASRICRHIVVIAGNHDSPSLLMATKPILDQFHVNVVGAVSENIEDEVLVLSDEHNNAQLIVCAVPYLRDKDIRFTYARESIEQKENNLNNAIVQHYEAVFKVAKDKQHALKRKIPIVAMGHLFTAGGKTIDGDGVRELYVGNLSRISSTIFPDFLSYVALGHLHIEQCVNHNEKIRYCGSPMAIGFGEASQKKIVCKVTISNETTSVQPIEVPVFQQLISIHDDWPQIEQSLLKLKEKDEPVWVDIEYTGEQIQGNLRERIEEIVEHSSIEVLRISNRRVVEKILQSNIDHETLEDLNEEEVFIRCLEANEVPEQQRSVLLADYHKIIDELGEA